MAIDWSHLPRVVIDNVCMSSGGCNRGGFSLNRETGYWVCSGCKKPSVTVAVKQCDLCDKVFIPKYYEKILYDFMGIACDECEPPKQTSGRTDKT
jgi:hypothetical protein